MHCSNYFASMYEDVTEEWNARYINYLLLNNKLLQIKYQHLFSNTFFWDKNLSWAVWLGVTQASVI